MKINGEALRALRERSGLSGIELATAAGISPQYLYDIEGGRRNLARNPALIKRLADELDVPVLALTRSVVA